ncbi:MAG: UDP-N-acetylmuramate--alanine ligase [Alphaproteobacteria bacterium]|nr:UDP-N-acetylmuramate--alanine ligase [Alphaproteobacteria bacterium]
MATFFFCGIGGTGMSALALYLKQFGHTVLGSDRSFDMGRNDDMRQHLTQAGILIVPQNGLSISSRIDTFVVSSAVEDSIPDVTKAQELGLTIKTRANILAEVFNTHFGMAVAGTSGKTTTTAMIGHILYETGHSVAMLNGGVSCNSYNHKPCSNFIYTGEDACLIEADESDGSIAEYLPDISVLTNVSLDHKSLDEIRRLFRDFLDKTKHGTVMNLDDPESLALNVQRPNNITFSIQGNPEATLSASNIQESLQGCTFVLNGSQNIRLPVIGKYNIANALAAVGVCIHLRIAIAESFKVLESFKGVKRRMNYIGTGHGAYVFDDYAHNPAKIKAAIDALLPLAKRLFIVYQPHSFEALRLTKKDLIQTLGNVLSERTEWLMLPVFYAGGTVIKDISSQDVVGPLQTKGKRAFTFHKRDEILLYLRKRVCPGDVAIVMGARDETLTSLAQDIVKVLQREDEL